MRVAVIGAGIVGACVAWHLAARGAQVTIFDRGRVGAATTAIGAGGARSQFVEPGEIRFALESVEFYAQAARTIGDDCGFRRVGFLNLIRNNFALVGGEYMMKVGRSLGADWRMITPDEVARLVPGAVVDGLIAASYTPNDGTANQLQATRAILKHAVSLGAVVREKTEVVRFVRAGGMLASIATARERVNCDAAVLATGPWAPELGKLAGLTVPIKPFRRHLFTVPCPADLPEDVPMTFDVSTSVYFRRDGDSLVISAQEPRGPFDHTTDVEIERGPIVLRQVRRLLPALNNVSITGGRAGFRESTEDSRAMIGPVAALPGLYVAIGFSAHGFSHAPAAGRALADLILDGKRDPALDLFIPERFAERPPVRPAPRW